MIKALTSKLSLWLQVCSSGNKKERKKKKKSKDEATNEVLRSTVEDDVFENDESDKRKDN